jgi:hypothetical protein
LLGRWRPRDALGCLTWPEVWASHSRASAFKGIPLNELAIQNTRITDLTPRHDMPLKDIRLTPQNIAQGLHILRDMKSPRTIGIS